ncbi:DUF6281 family protein [Streptomyces smyrnaeus]|uniref:DUF6281 family protein n=1 Tax=Streptomyces smyrnaeus TaxID=1387713 RepID=UPI0033C16836
MNGLKPRQCALITAAVIVSTLSFSCSDSEKGSGENAEDAFCAKSIEFQNRTYWGMGDIEIRTGDQLGRTHLRSCNDMGRDEAPAPTWNLPVYEARGFDKEIAVGVKDGRGVELYSVRDDGKFPPQVRKLVNDSRK